MKEPTLNSEFWRFLSSSILITLSGTLGFVVDGIIVGNLIGEDGVSAINLNMPLLQFLYTISMLLSTGAGMLVGMEIGKKNFTRAAYVFTVSMVSCMVVGLLFSVAGLETPGIVAGFLCNNERLLEPTTRYLVPMLMGTPVYMMMWALSNMVSVDGSPRLVSIAIVIDNVVNLAFDVILIQGLSMGIAGSSIASIIGHLVGIAIMCRHFFYKDNNLHFSRTHSKPAFGEIISQGAPLAVASICLTLLFYSANAIVLSSMGHV
ncbi:MAG: MATE family efflux transporter, partial [Prevotella sp.]